jgi:eukaryotic-like serine/threonine-protein kinase
MTCATRGRLHNRAMASPVGTLLSKRYRLDAKVGTGGMSTVYRAFDTVLERQVAIKLMHREIAGDSDQLERFRREARAVAQLNHPHVVGVIDAGEEGDPDYPTPYIVFEYVEGETLKQRIRRNGRLPVAESIAYAIEVARALGAAHERQIVHRDVKPQNVLVDEEGAAKVTDFGIARTLHQEGLTADGRVLGTTDYVSPEQALGHAVSGQSDLYSLGIVIFEMLTGDVPFKGENQIAVAMKHVREDLPDVQIRRPEVSAALAAVLDRATAKELDRRYRNAHAMIAELEDVLAIETARSGQVTGEATTVLRSLPETTRRRVPLRARSSTKALIGLLVVVVAAAGALTYIAAQRAERGTGKRAGGTPTPRGLTEVGLGQRSISDFDPLGGDGEHPEQTSALVDGVSSTTWATESYDGAQLSKAGVGVVIDASPGVAARKIVLRTPTPGFEVSIWVAPSGRPETAPPKGWTQVSSASIKASESEAIDLDTAGNRYGRYLVWITKLPPGEKLVRLSEILLYR